MPEADRFARAIAAIDEANAADPRTVVVDGDARPLELAHAEVVTRWVRVLDPHGDELQLRVAGDRAACRHGGAGRGASRTMGVPVQR